MPGSSSATARCLCDENMRRLGGTLSEGGRTTKDAKYTKYTKTRAVSLR